jgi:hypothetical protein
MEYIVFFSCLALLCVIFPPLMGFATGVIAFCCVWYVFYKMIGGRY